MLVDFEEYNGVYSMESEIMRSPFGFAFSGVGITAVNARMRSEIFADKLKTVRCKGFGDLYFFLVFGLRPFLGVVPVLVLD